ncbi:MAG: hypothetical protein V4628_12670 [Pseudomonadota bacterium]
MRKSLAAAALLAAALSTQFVNAAEPDFDFEELMEKVEFNANELQTSIVFEDVDAGVQLATELRDAFSKIEGFFAEWGYANDAVEYSQQYQARAEKIIASLKEKNFTGASDQALEFTKACKACHDNYKPL